MPTPVSARGTTKIAAVSLAAAALLGVTGAPVAAASDVKACKVQCGPVTSVEQRVAGINADMARAVELRQVTPEQAAFVAEQLVRRIQTDSVPFS